MAALAYLQLTDLIDHSQPTNPGDDGSNATPGPTPGPSRKRTKTEPPSQTKTDPDEKKVNVGKPISF